MILLFESISSSEMMIYYSTDRKVPEHVAGQQQQKQMFHPEAAETNELMSLNL